MRGHVGQRGTAAEWPTALSAAVAGGHFFLLDKSYKHHLHPALPLPHIPHLPCPHTAALHGGAPTGEYTVTSPLRSGVHTGSVFPWGQGRQGRGGGASSWGCKGVCDPVSSPASVCWQNRFQSPELTAHSCIHVIDSQASHACSPTYHICGSHTRPTQASLRDTLFRHPNPPFLYRVHECI